MTTAIPTSYASERTTLAKALGPVTGEPSVLNTAGDNTIYTPQTGKAIRLKWISLYSDPDNTAKCVALVKWSGASGNLYQPIFPPGPGMGAFQHKSVREGAPDETLIVNLSATQTIYVAGLDVEEF